MMTDQQENLDSLPCSTCNGDGGAHVRFTDDEWDWLPCSVCRGTGENPESLVPCPTCDGGARQFGQTNAGIFKRCPQCDGRTEVPAENPDSLLPTDWEGTPIDRPLVDDLADVLACTVVGWQHLIGHDLAEAPNVKRVLARYRASKAGSDG